MGRNKIYPIEQEVKCAVCSTPGVRRVNSYRDTVILWFCCQEHKEARLGMVRRGELPVTDTWKRRKNKLVRQKSPEEIRDIKMSRQVPKCRRDPDSIASPSDYEKRLWSK